jgi:hypothetical protein
MALTISNMYQQLDTGDFDLESNCLERIYVKRP